MEMRRGFAGNPSSVFLSRSAGVLFFKTEGEALFLHIVLQITLLRKKKNKKTKHLSTTPELLGWIKYQV